MKFVRQQVGASPPSAFLVRRRRGAIIYPDAYPILAHRQSCADARGAGIPAVRGVGHDVVTRRVLVAVALSVGAANCVVAPDFCRVLLVFPETKKVICAGRPEYHCARYSHHHHEGRERGPLSSDHVFLFFAFARLAKPGRAAGAPVIGRCEPCLFWRARTKPSIHLPRESGNRPISGDSPPPIPRLRWG